MLFAGAGVSLNPNPWRFQPHPEVWLLIVFLVAAFIYAVRVIGPRVAPAGHVISQRQTRLFILMITLLWLATDWPMHDIAEEYLYSVHMVQHLTLSYFIPALALMCVPEWMFRLLIGTGRIYRVVRFATKPVVAGLAFNLVVMITHIPKLVNLSASKGPLHYSLHILLVTTALMFWSPVCGPLREWQLKPGGKMIYMFVLSFVPTIPAGWLTFATGSVYRHYDTPIRVWGISVLGDQQAAGGIMKLGGSVFIWAIIIFLFFKRFIGNFHEQQSYLHDDNIPDSEIVGTEEPLLYEDVTRAFSQVRPPIEE